MSLAQDMSAVFGQDLSSSAVQLGKALEDPVEGLTALRRVGVSFTESQKELIKSLVEAGETAEAQRIILDNLARQVGGAGEAEAGGLVGAAHRARAAWGNLLEEIGKTSWVARMAQRELEAMASYDRQTTAWLHGSSSDGGATTVGASGDWQGVVGGRDQAAATAGREAAEAERRAENLGKIRGDLDKALTKVATPAEKIKAINDELATTKKRLEALRTGDTSKDVDAQIKRAEELAARKAKEVNDEETRRQEAAASKDEAAQRKVDQARKEYERNEKIIADLERKKLGTEDPRTAFTEQALSRLSEKATEDQITRTKAAADAAFQAEAVDTVIRGIDQQAAAAERLAAVSGAGRRRRASGDPGEPGVCAGGGDRRRRRQGLCRHQGATARRPRTRGQGARRGGDRQGAALPSGRPRRRQTRVEPDRRERRQARRRGGAAAREATAARTVPDRHRERDRQPDQDQRRDRQDQRDDQGGRGRPEAVGAARQAGHRLGVQRTRRRLSATKSWDDAFKAIDKSIQQLLVNAFIKQPLEKFADSFFSQLMGGGSGGGGTGGGNPFGQWGNQAASWLGGLFGSSGGGGSLINTGGPWMGTQAEMFAALHEGGIVGEAGAPRLLPAAVFAGAPRFHGGLAPDEIPAILQRGEAVLTRRQQAAVGAGMRQAATPGRST